MNKLNMTAIAAAISLVFSAGVMAQSMSKDAYKAADDLIAAEYTTEMCIRDSSGPAYNRR